MLQKCRNEYGSDCFRPADAFSIIFGKRNRCRKLVWECWWEREHITDIIRSRTPPKIRESRVYLMRKGDRSASTMEVLSCATGASIADGEGCTNTQTEVNVCRIRNIDEINGCTE